MPAPEDFTQAEHATAPTNPTLVQQAPPTHLFDPAALPDVPGYVVSREVARGGMGVVYAAHDPVFDREVAVKVMRPGHDPDRFVVESKITARLSHPGVPPVYALGTLADGRAFLAMKLIRGRTLADELAAGDPPRLLGVFEQICQTVGFAHAQGIIHRDLKPANVMVGDYGEVLVMDWGLAKAVASGQWSVVSEDHEDRLAATRSGASDDVTQLGTVKGTPAFMAPEQARGEPVDARADVFALGGILAVMLTGKPPFCAASVVDTVKKAAAGDLREAVAELDGCGADPELVALAKRCVAATAADRFADGSAVAEAVAAYRAGVEERLRRAERDRAVREAEARESRKRRRVQLALAAAVAVLLAAGGAFAWYSDRQAEAQARKQLQEEAAAAQRHARNHDAAAAMLGQAEAALRAGDAEQAAKPLAEAERRIGEGGAEDLRERFDHCRADLATQRELDALDDLRWTPAGLRLLTWTELAPRLARAFARYGITPGVTPPAEAARRINDSHVREALLAHLEIWAAVGDRDPGVLAILSLADPDEFREAVRAKSYPWAALARGFRGKPAPAPPVWFAIGRVQDAHLPAAAREQILLAALRDRPNSFPLLMTLVNLGDKLDKASALVRAGWCRAALAARPGSLAAWNNLGVALVTAGDRSGAAAAYEKAIALDPTSAPPRSNLGNVFLDSDPARAVAEYDRALAINPNYAHAHANRGVALMRLGRLPEAAMAEQKAIDLDPDYAQAHYTLGLVLIRMKDWQNSAASSRRAIELSPKFLGAFNNLGIALRNAGDLAGAEKAYKTAIDLGDGVVVYTNLAGVYHEQKRYAEAVWWVSEGIRLDPGYPKAYVVLGDAQLALGDNAEARKAYRTAGQLEPLFWGLILKVPPPSPAPPPREVTRP